MIASIKLLLVTALAILTNLDKRHHATGSRVKRDDSGLMTVNDLLDNSHAMCDKLNTVDGMLESPMTMGMGEAILDQPMPVPNPAVLDVFGLVGMLFQQFDKIEDMINGKDNGGDTPTDADTTTTTEADTTTTTEADTTTTTEADTTTTTDADTTTTTDNPTTTTVGVDLVVERANFMMTPRDLMAMGKFLCKLLETTRNVMNSPAVSWMGLGNHWLPLPDSAHPLDFVKILDPLGLFQIPGNVLNMFGMGAPPTTTTTTEAPWNFFG